MANPCYVDQLPDGLPSLSLGLTFKRQISQKKKTDVRPQWRGDDDAGFVDYRDHAYLLYEMSQFGRLSSYNRLLHIKLNVFSSQFGICTQI